TCSSAFHTELGNSSISDKHVFFVALYFTTRFFKKFQLFLKKGLTFSASGCIIISVRNIS
ncbi:hypothetical protein, partial [Streptococcus dysgalactiae]|uniref:hypothetical protein n=1 Tax=Streptococcus dysgalactiae TaxID=1334 RepID=UPI001A9CA9A2